MNSVIIREVGKDPLYKTWHRSGRYMIIFVHSGEGSLVTSEKIYPFRSGTLAFVGADKYHYTMPNDPQRYIRSKLFVSSGELVDILRLFSAERDVFEKFSGNTVVFAEDSGEDKDACEEIIRELSSEAKELPRVTMLSAYLRLMIILLKKAGEPVGGFSGIHRAVEYINENIASSFTLDDIARAAHLSKYHFCREFKKQCGLTVSEYILKTRIILAKALLNNRGATVTETALNCGFCSASHFSRIFKEKTGTTPLAYKKMLKNEKVFKKD